MFKKTADIKTVRVDEKLKHIAFIMDGNGRWAKNKGLPREAGHKYGALKFQEVIKYCSEIGLKAVTVYAFSTENWKRPENEVKSLMNLFESYIDDCISKVADYNVKIKFIGDMSCFKDSFGDTVYALAMMRVDGVFGIYEIGFDGVGISPLTTIDVNAKTKIGIEFFAEEKTTYIYIWRQK